MSPGKHMEGRLMQLSQSQVQMSMFMFKLKHADNPHAQGLITHKLHNSCCIQPACLLD